MNDLSKEMKRKAIGLIGVVAAASAMCVGCGGESDPINGEIAEEDLSEMVLNLPELDPKFDHLRLDEEQSGEQANDDIIADSFDPEDDRDDLVRFGRLTGYTSAYSSDDQSAEVFFGATAVSLYEGSAGASGDLHDEADDAVRTVWERNDGLILQAAEQFDPGSAGDESEGLTLALGPSDGEGDSLYGTLVAFRRGRLVGGAFLVSRQQADLRSEAIEVAKKLDERIVAVLSE